MDDPDLTVSNFMEMNPYMPSVLGKQCEPRPLGYKKNFMLNSTEREISTAHNY